VILRFGVGMQWCIEVSYHIIETPDHLHRGLHLFAIHHLRSLLRRIKSARDFGRIEFTPDDDWFLKDVLSIVKPHVAKPRWLARKEAKEFFRKYPYLKERPENNFVPRSIEERMAESAWEQEWLEEYKDYEISEDLVLDDSSPIIDAIEQVESSIQSKQVEAVCDATASLTAILYEHATPPRHLAEALESIFELLNRGARSDARLLDSDEKEAYEITQLCRGEFRRMASGGVSLLRKLRPTDFENFVAELFAQHGLRDVHTTPVVADGGADVIAYRFQDGNQIKYIIQCKRYSIENRVSVGVVRELVGVKLDLGAAHALLVTTSDFTAPARNFVQRNRSKVWGVRLVNYRTLEKLLSLTD